MTRNIKNKYASFSLLEVVIGSCVISVGLLGLAYIQNISNKTGKIIRSSTSANMLIADMASKIAANPTVALLTTNANQAGAANVYTDINLLSAAPASMTDYKCNDTQSCTANQLAQQDLREWKLQLAQVLPTNYAISITSSTVGSTSTQLYVLQISWADADGTQQAIKQQVTVDAKTAAATICNETTSQEYTYVYGVYTAFNVTWQNTIVGGMKGYDCPVGTDISGRVYRICNPGGTWSATMNFCIPLCVASPDPRGITYWNGVQQNWQATLYNSWAQSINCPAGYNGTMRRYCDATGAWGSLDVSGCTSGSCPAISEYSYGSLISWPQTSINNAAVAACPLGYNGTATRFCSPGPTWGTVSGCSLNNPCNAGTTNSPGLLYWPETGGGLAATQACPSGYIGTASRLCQANGTWAANVTGCTSKCAATTTTTYGTQSWPTTNPGVAATQSCPAGYIGTASYACQANGTWGALSGCTPQCPATVTITYGTQYWPATNPSTTATQACPVGYSGTASYACQANGTWGALTGCS